MAHDDILAELGADWRRQTADLERLHMLTERRRRGGRLALAAKVVGTGIALAAGLWFVRLALSGDPAVFALAGAVLLGALPLMVMEIAGTARLTRAGANETPAEALQSARAQAAAALKLLWASRVAALLLAACATGLVVLYAAGQASARDAASFAPIWAFVALIGWYWQSLRARRLRAEIAHCDLMVEELNDTKMS